MPRYFFPIIDGHKLPDKQGEVLDNDAQARDQAQLIARHIEMVHGAPRFIVVENEDGEEIHKEPVNRR